ncbi:hypothetical protein AALC17_06160 [Oscillospiraceae bacterium 38-13]
MKMGISWAAAALLTALEAPLAWGWIWGTRYVLKYGAEENPYAAEDAEIMGILALAVLPLFLAALTWAVYETVCWCKKRAEARSER